MVSVYLASAQILVLAAVVIRFSEFLNPHNRATYRTTAAAFNNWKNHINPLDPEFQEVPQIAPTKAVGISRRKR